MQPVWRFLKRAVCGESELLVELNNVCTYWDWALNQIGAAAEAENRFDHFLNTTEAPANRIFKWKF